jgi:ubiquinone/menaquinone biosynthesis C-methylase UbiE
MKNTEYDNIDVIGNTHKTTINKTEFYLNNYYHQSQKKSIKKILNDQKLSNFSEIIDLGCSHGSWYESLKSFGFKKLIGIDISKERLELAKQIGYEETYCTNGKSLPFNDNSKDIVVSNNMLIHVLQDSDKLEILKEIKRILTPNGLFIFDIANATVYEPNNVTKKYCNYITTETIEKIISESGLVIAQKEISYCLYPLKIAHPKLAKYSVKTIFPLIDKIFRFQKNYNKARSIHYCLRKSVVTN